MLQAPGARQQGPEAGKHHGPKLLSPVLCGGMDPNGLLGLL